MIKDVIIAKLNFPNDPTSTIIAHQMFVGEDTNDHISLYSISSLPGKERRVYGSEKDNYATILFPEYQQNGFKLPSFIDCAKMYKIAIDGRCDLQALTQRNIAPELKNRIENKITELKEQNKHITYNISEDNFLQWNPRTLRADP